MENQDTNYPPKVDQSTIEDIAVYAAMRGVEVLKIGMEPEVYAAYNRNAYLRERITLMAAALPEDEKCGTCGKPKKVAQVSPTRGCIEIVSLPPR